VRLDCEISRHLNFFLIRFYYRLHRDLVSKSVVNTKRDQLRFTRNNKYILLQNKLIATLRLLF